MGLGRRRCCGGAECFEDEILKKPEMVWTAVLTTCADAWLTRSGLDASGRPKWLSKHLDKLHDAIVAAKSGHVLGWIEQCKEWTWTWPGKSGRD